MQNQTREEEKNKTYFFKIKRKNNPTLTLTQIVDQSNRCTIKKLNKE